MAVATVSRFQLAPGRREEFVTVAGERDDVIERLGGRVELRRATIAGEASEQIERVEYYPDTQSRATALDVFSHSPPPGLRELAAASDPPAAIVRRYLLDEFAPLEDNVQERARLLTVHEFRAPEGRFDELEAAIASASEQHAAIGARARAWSMPLAGAQTGHVRFELAHDSYSAAAETARRLIEADAALGRPGPLERLIRGGSCVASGYWMLVE